jgi:hypothetical protein
MEVLGSICAATKVLMAFHLRELLQLALVLLQQLLQSARVYAAKAGVLAALDAATIVHAVLVLPAVQPDTQQMPAHQMRLRLAQIARAVQQREEWALMVFWPYVHSELPEGHVLPQQTPVLPLVLTGRHLLPFGPREQGLAS